MEISLSTQCKFRSIANKMYQYIDANKIIQVLPQIHNCSEYNPRYCHDPDITIEFPVYLFQEETLDSCTVTKVKSSSALFNLPFSHYAEFKGISTNMGIFTKSGVLNNSACGYIHVYVYNSSTESRVLPIGMRLGTLCLKKFYDTLDEDTCS